VKPRAKGFLPEERGSVRHLAGRPLSSVTPEMPGPRTTWPRDRVDSPRQNSCPRLVNDLLLTLKSQRRGSTPSKPIAADPKCRNERNRLPNVRRPHRLPRIWLVVRSRPIWAHRCSRIR